MNKIELFENGLVAYLMHPEEQVYTDALEDFLIENECDTLAELFAGKNKFLYRTINVIAKVKQQISGYYIQDIGKTWFYHNKWKLSHSYTSNSFAQMFSRPGFPSDDALALQQTANGMSWSNFHINYNFSSLLEIFIYFHTREQAEPLIAILKKEIESL